jgi:hypothetical protein
MAKREGVWLIEGRWVRGDDRAWGVIHDRGPYPTRAEAASEASALAWHSVGGHLYRARLYVPAAPKQPKPTVTRKVEATMKCDKCGGIDENAHADDCPNNPSPPAPQSVIDLFDALKEALAPKPKLPAVRRRGKGKKP